MNPRWIEPTAILDFNSTAVSTFATCLDADDDSALGFLRAAHARLANAIAPAYTVDDRRPISTTLSTGRGSCSQRLACLEGLARRRGIGTRVRALWVSGTFWRLRFPVARFFIPRRVLLPWPEFAVDGQWLGVEDIYGVIEQRAQHAHRFTNDGESLFEAIRSTAIDFDGRTQACTSACDLSSFVLAREGPFDSRDDLFNRLGCFDETIRGKVFEMMYGDRNSA